MTCGSSMKPADGVVDGAIVVVVVVVDELVVDVVVGQELQQPPRPPHAVAPQPVGIELAHQQFRHDLSDCSLAPSGVASADCAGARMNGGGGVGGRVAVDEAAAVAAGGGFGGDGGGGDVVVVGGDDGEIGDEVQDVAG